MQELLTGKRRLLGYKSSSSFQTTFVGPVPEDWEVSTVGDEFEVQLGKMLDAEKNVGTYKPYIGNRDVKWNHIDVTDLSSMAMSESDLTNFRLKQGDLLVCEGGEVGRAAIWQSPLEECYFQKAIHRLRARNRFQPRLMVSFLQHWASGGFLSNYVTQTSIAHLPKDKFVTIPLPKPSVEELTAIVAIISDIECEITELESNLSKARRIKQAMLQELLTGRIRLIPENSCSPRPASGRGAGGEGS